MSKTAFVTGGTRGIGLAITKALSAQGYIVAAGYCQNDAAAMQMQRECGASLVKGDLGTPGNAAVIAKQALELLGHIDVLVNNASISAADLFQCMSPERVQRLYQVNLFGTTETVRFLLPEMINRKKGCILNVGPGRSVLRGGLLSGKGCGHQLYKGTCQRSRTFGYTCKLRIAGRYRYGNECASYGRGYARTCRGNSPWTYRQT